MRFYNLQASRNYIPVCGISLLYFNFYLCGKARTLVSTRYYQFFIDSHLDRSIIIGKPQRTGLSSKLSYSILVCRIVQQAVLWIRIDFYADSDDSGSSNLDQCGTGARVLHLNFFLSLALHEGRPRESLQPSKENIKHFKTWNFFTFSIFAGHYYPHGSESGSNRPNQYGPTRIRIHNTATRCMCARASCKTGN